jgi:hypothetical protein
MFSLHTKKEGIMNSITTVKPPQIISVLPTQLQNNDALLIIKIRKIILSINKYIGILSGPTLIISGFLIKIIKSSELGDSNDILGTLIMLAGLGIILKRIQLQQME